MTKLCRMVLRLFPKEFLKEFGDDIVSSFQAHYEEEIKQGKSKLFVLYAQLADISNLVLAAFSERWRLLGTSKNFTEEGLGLEMENYRVIRKVYFAWQAREEAEWLREMSREGWDYVEFNWFRYYFRKMPQPVEYQYFFERNYFSLWQTGLESRYLESRAESGWEYFKYFKMWYYFRRPAAGQPNLADPFGEGAVAIFPNHSGGLFTGLFLLLLAALLIYGSTVNHRVSSFLSGVCSGFFLGLGIFNLGVYFYNIFKKKQAATD